MAVRTGSIERRGNRYRVRVRMGRGKRVALGTYGTRAEAQEVLDAWLAMEESGELLSFSDTTVGGWLDDWFTRRERSGQVRHVGKERSPLARAKAAPFAGYALTSLRPVDVEDWLLEVVRERSKSTAKHAFSLLRQAMQDALKRGLVEANPCAAVKAPDPPAHRRAPKDETPDFYSLEELEQLLRCEDIPLRSRRIHAVAIYAGLRRGEIFGLEWQDLDLDGRAPHVWVRRTVRRLPPKSGRARRVPLIGPALHTLRAWREECDRSKAPDAYVFATRDGGMHGASYDAAWSDHTPTPGGKTYPGCPRRAGIRYLKFPALRHTAASHLLLGSWGRRWRREEVRDFRGHRDIHETQIYAKLAPDSMSEAAALTPGNGWDQGVVPGWSQARPDVTPELAAKLLEALRESVAGDRGFEPLTFGSGVSRSDQRSRDVTTPLGPPRDQARLLLQEIAGGELARESVDATALALLREVAPEPVRLALRALLGALDEALATELAGATLALEDGPAVEDVG